MFTPTFTPPPGSTGGLYERADLTKKSSETPEIMKIRRDDRWGRRRDKNASQESTTCPPKSQEQAEAVRTKPSHRDKQFNGLRQNDFAVDAQRLNRWLKSWSFSQIPSSEVLRSRQACDLRQRARPNDGMGRGVRANQKLILKTRKHAF